MMAGERLPLLLVGLGVLDANIGTRIKSLDGHDAVGECALVANGDGLKQK